MTNEKAKEFSKAVVVQALKDWKFLKDRELKSCKMNGYLISILEIEKFLKSELGILMAETTDIDNLIEDLLEGKYDNTGKEEMA